ncbi:MAG: penicillin-binding protein 1A [Alphaproteobacteria bacterium]|nr:penicillin-binding protein 1A [Alphaproteobacteria bacterium]
MKKILRILIITTVTLVLLTLAGGAAVLGVFWHYGRGLPDYQQLATYEPPVMTRVHAGDGRLVTEYATEKRAFVPIGAIPRRVINAFLAAEDKNFYSHPGVDVVSVLRAVVTNLKQLGRDRRLVGASTITQQVAKNFLLTNEVSLARKVKEAILAFRIEQAFSKDRILELYLNEIYLGFGSYGAAAAALNYFNKSMDELTIAEAAYLAALPKAPNNYHPVRRPKAARSRRDWVISRMEEEGFITPAEAGRARADAIVVRPREQTLLTRAEYFAEEVRRQLMEHYGEKKLYRGGLSVRTTLDSKLQAIADDVLRKGLIAYDRRHGWRGPIARIEGLETGAAPEAAPGAGPGPGEGPGTAKPGAAKSAVKAKAGAPLPPWALGLAKVPAPTGLGPWRLALVLGVEKKQAGIGFTDGGRGTIPIAELRWAREWRKGQKRGPWVSRVDQVLKIGDIIAVEAVSERIIRPAKRSDKPKLVTYPPLTFGLRQIPDINGGLVALDPHTGRVLAMSGGLAFAESQFNRATQAKRQPGSAFKPFVYLSALGQGFTPSSLILDAPFVIDQGPGLGLWKPHNYARRFYGPSTMRLGLEKSRNLMTVRMAQTIGMEKIAATARKFAIHKNLPLRLSMALGAGETTLLKLVTGYAMLVNGGKKITPTFIDRIQDRHGVTIFRHDKRPCPGCRLENLEDMTRPVIADMRERVADAGNAYQVVSMLRGVVLRGTGRRVAAVGKPLAGKTGTTNKSMDTWFIGFTPDLAAGVFVGFDKPKPLGRRETGSSVSAPIFRDFMARALKGKPAIPFRIPPGIRLVRINAQTGLLARPGDKRVILEAFKPGTEPTGKGGVIEGRSAAARDGGEVSPRGLY